MVRNHALSAEAIRVLIQIHEHGIYVWVRGKVLIVNDKPRTRLRPQYVEELLALGYLSEDPEELTLHLTNKARIQVRRLGKTIHRSSRAPGSRSR